MQVDYTAICACGWEKYDSRLSGIKKISKLHLFDPYLRRAKKHEICIDRNVNLEIDDTFKSLVLKK